MGARRQYMLHSSPIAALGRIFKNAREVIAWIGNDNDVATLFSFANATTDRSTNMPAYDTSLIQRALEQHVFWKRAWITQELLLAKHLTFKAGKTSYHIPEKAGLYAGWDESKIQQSLRDSLQDLLGHTGEENTSSLRVIENLEILKP
jgi:hypothetical protein